MPIGNRKTVVRAAYMGSGAQLARNQAEGAAQRKPVRRTKGAPIIKRHASGVTGWRFVTRALRSEGR